MHLRAELVTCLETQVVREWSLGVKPRKTLPFKTKIGRVRR
ncbi:hypothetical protein HBZC1_17800 [Helicobacter bizzozeronii CIII-1]|uniref:Uncharacterized protein n=1 Tax=Helicobacter bizzozeronii (strain CIII-1) TaxID=1002804 RepID=F8KPN6_HELBC|nr:hypothetical protein HBZC1_17800 [Helicobacter bizzozeronii CIII-1]